MKKRLISMFLVLVMALGLFPISAFAASSTIAGALGEVNITNGDYKMSYLSMNGVVRSQSYTYFNFKSASGAIKEIPAYCINPTITVIANDQSGQNSGAKLLSGSVRVDGYNRHLDILYEARLLLSA